MEGPERSLRRETGLLKQLHGIDERLSYAREKRDACNAPGQNETQSARIGLNMLHLSLLLLEQVFDFN
ncbi:MAG: hypothetical protein J0H39_23920 [Alphaproteobacteria bacterium]|nr:hypothetical protein [Alphaproteobacteria bacterium]